MRRQSTPKPPRSVIRATAAIFAIAGIHLLALVLLVTHRDVITAAVAAAHPGWPSSKIDAEGASRFLQSLLPHAILPVVFVLRGRRLLEGRRRTRLIVTFLLGVQLLAHATLPLQLDRLPGYAGWLVAVQSVSLVFELGALWLLWKPQESRTFFARKRTPVPTPA